MLNTDIKACPVFTRWQVCCHKCGAMFYIDCEPEDTEDDILALELEDMACELHPNEGSVIELA